jgi:hypothetical protein
MWLSCLQPQACNQALALRTYMSTTTAEKMRVRQRLKLYSFMLGHCHGTAEDLPATAGQVASWAKSISWSWTKQLEAPTTQEVQGDGLLVHVAVIVQHRP